LSNGANKLDKDSGVALCILLYTCTFLCNGDHAQFL
jgi:hypothetical protein